MKSKASILLYIGNDQDFAKMLEKEHHLMGPGFIHLNEGTALLAFTQAGPASLEQACLIIDGDLSPYGGLALALYLAQNKIVHLGSYILTNDNLVRELLALSDFFIESCHCCLNFGPTEDWRQVHESFL